MLPAMFSAVTGMKNHLTRMTVIGNNIANVNSVAFKGSRVTFQEALQQTMRHASRGTDTRGGINPIQVGLGMRVGSIGNSFTQGSLQGTGRPTDLALSGDGFFILSDGTGQIFTRSGAFAYDESGYLVDPANGYRVQGRVANQETGELTGTVGDIQIDFGQVEPPNATSELKIAGNLDAATLPNETILRNRIVRATELAGDGNDVNGLYAFGNADQTIIGMEDEADTVSVTDGVGGTQAYLYRRAGVALADNEFHTLDELVAAVNQDFGAAGSNSLSVALNAGGQLEWQDLSGASNLLTVSSSNNILDTATGVVAADVFLGNVTSDEFHHVATSADLLVNLKNEDGDSLGLVAGDEITVDGQVAGTAVTTGTLTVLGTTTYGALAQEVQLAFGITNATGVEIHAGTGALNLTGDKGLANELSELDIRADDTAGAGGAERTDFVDVFGNRVGNWSELQEASDVTHVASMAVIDSSGEQHEVTVTLTKDPNTPNLWTWEASVAGVSGIAGGTGQVSFNEDGSLLSWDFNGESALIFDPGNGAADLEITIAAGTFGEFDGLTQFASASTALFRSQDGYPEGALDTVAIDANGVFVGTFRNGIQRNLAQLMIANFDNPRGLLSDGGGVYKISPNSGVPELGVSGVEHATTVASGFLELSNVDLGEEFTDMIVTQRGFQANARVVSASDEMLTELINLRR